jgi:protein-disulfide isomerase
VPSVLRIIVVIALVGTALAQVERVSSLAVAAAGPVEPMRRLDLSHAPARGPADAPVTIVEFSDLQCPFCRNAIQPLSEMVDGEHGRVRWVFKNFPLSFHTEADLAHRAALAAAAQGKFWEMHDLIFQNQVAITRDNLLQYAQRLGLELTRFQNDLESDAVRAAIRADIEEGQRLKIDGTPTFFVNGIRVVGLRSAAELRQIVEHAGSSAHQALFSQAAQVFAPLVVSGPPQAEVTLTWFSDILSGLEPNAASLVREIVASYGGKVRVVYRVDSLPQRVGARLAHQALLAAGAAGRFWPMHDAIVAHAGRITPHDLLDDATKAGLDRRSFEQALADPQVGQRFDNDLEEVRRRDIRGTPVFFIDNIRVDGIQPLALFRRIIDATLAARSQASTGEEARR